MVGNGNRVGVQLRVAEHEGKDAVPMVGDLVSSAVLHKQAFISGWLPPACLAGCECEDIGDNELNVCIGDGVEPGLVVQFSKFSLQFQRLLHGTNNIRFLCGGPRCGVSCSCTSRRFAAGGYLYIATVVANDGEQGLVVGIVEAPRDDKVPNGANMVFGEGGAGGAGVVCITNRGHTWTYCE